MNRSAGVTRRVRSTDDGGFPRGRRCGFVGRAHRKAARHPAAPTPSMMAQEEKKTNKRKEMKQNKTNGRGDAGLAPNGLSTQRTGGGPLVVAVHAITKIV